MVCGPTEQLRPITSAPKASNDWAMSSTDTPYGVAQSAPIVICAMTGIVGSTSCAAANRLFDLVEIGECLENEQITSALLERLHLLAECRARLIEARWPVWLKAHTERPNRSGNEDVVAGYLARKLHRGAC